MLALLPSCIWLIIMKTAFPTEALLGRPGTADWWPAAASGLTCSNREFSDPAGSRGGPGSEPPVLGFALTVFKSLQPLTEGPSAELPPALLPAKQRGVRRREHVT